jgi:VWFA-related protein
VSRAAVHHVVVLNRRQWLLAAAAAPLASRSFGQQQPEELPEALIRVDVQVVNILATVRDKDGRLVNSLTKDDFEIYEDGEPQDIQYFGRQTDLPLTIGLLVDTSVSQQRVVEIERSAGYQFFDEILRVDKDLAFLMSFDIDVELLQDLTASKRLLQDGLQRLQVQGGPSGGITPGPVPQSGRPVGTAMYDSIYLAATEILKPQVGRKAVVVIGDGNDYGSKIDEDEAIAEAHRTDTVIYSVRYFDREFYFRSGALGGGGSGALKKLARETGGSMYEVDRKRTLNEIFDDINAELRNQYSLGYSPKKDLSVQGFRKVEVKMKRKGYDVQAREGYYPEAFK